MLIASSAKLDTEKSETGGQVDLSPNITYSFKTPKGPSISTNRPLTKAAFMTLAENWPRSLDLDTLFQAAIQRMDADPKLQGKPVHRDRPTLAGDLLQCYTVNVAEFRTWQGDSVSKAGEHPKASPLAVYQCRQGEKSVVNLRHEQVPLDPLCQHLLPILDGTRNRAAQFDHLVGLIKNGALAAQQDNKPITDPELIRGSLENDIERRLAYLAGTALLIS